MVNAIKELLALEPVRVRAVITALIGLGLSLGIDLDQEGILSIVDTVLPWLAAAILFWRTRGQVTPNAKVVVTTDDVENLGAQG